MQDFRPPSWSVLRRHENALIDSGQAAKSGNFDLAVEILRAREVAEHAAEPAEPAEPTKSKRLLDSPEVSPKEKFGSARADTGVPESESEGGIAPEVLTEADDTSDLSFD
ncbi:unnamed protein product [Durusdinium trenchii]|uniref:Uncharacterized protein n=1 Tax=Durusdinium trenchii TaxID=1381693 RepID=A0ABP0H5A0_9DINO